MSRSAVPKPSGSGLSTPLNRSRESVSSSVSGIAKRTETWKVGDRVTAGEGKAGKVAFKGPTKFATGDWIGVALDQPNGKNDGSVDGVRYFTCDPKHGLFCKAGKLSKEDAAGEFRVPNPMEPSLSTAGSSKPGAASHSLAHHLDLSLADSLAGGDSVLATPVKGGPPSSFSLTSTPVGTTLPLEIGDRVVVSGNKVGVLRYMGSTDFASGQWAGVELDQPIGKNDGSVQGKRYFACKPQYGLFAPLSKVVRHTNQSGAGKLIVRHTKTSALRQRSGSQESLCSLNSSVFSSVSTSRPQRVRLGTSAFDTPESSPHLPRARLPASTAKRTGVIKSSSTAGGDTAVLQDALKEKEQHIEQLLKERDMERQEMTRASQQAEEAEQALADERAQFTRSQGEWELKLATLQKTLAELESEKKELSFCLDEEKKNSEDLTFQIEEESIHKAELESKVVSLSAAVPVPDCVNEKESEVKNLKEEIAGIRSEMARKEAQHSSEMGKSQAEILTLQNSLQTLKSEAEKLRSDLDSSEKEKSKLTQDFSSEKSSLQQNLQTAGEKDSVIEKLQQEISSQKLEMENLRTALSHDKDSAIAELQSQFASRESALADERDKLKTEFESFKTSSQAQNEELNNIRRELEATTSEKARLEKAVEEQNLSAQQTLLSAGEKDTVIADLRRKLEEQQKEAQTLRDNISQWVIKFEEAGQKEEEEKIEREQELEKLNAELKTSQETNTALEKKMIEVKTEFHGIQEAQKLAAETLAKSVLDQKNKLEAEIAQKKEEVGNLTGQCTSLQQNINSASQARVAVESELGKLREEFEKYRNESEAKSSANDAEKIQIIEQLEAAQKQRLETESTLKQQKEAEIVKDSRIETLCAELERLKGDIAAQEKVLAKSHDEAVNQLSAETAKIREELAAQKDREQKHLLEKQQLEQKIADQAAAQNELQSAKEKVESDLKSAKVELEEIKSSRKQLSEEGKKIESELETLKAEAVEINSAKTQAEDQLKATQSDLEKTKSDYNAAVKNLEELKQSLDVQNSSQGEIQIAKSKVEAALKSVEEELERVKAEHEASAVSFKEGREQQAKEYETQLAQLKTHLEESNLLVEQYKTKEQNKCDENSNLTKEIETLKQFIVDLEAQKTAMGQQSEEDTSRVASELSAAIKEKSDLEGQVRDLNSKLSEANQVFKNEKDSWESEKAKMGETSAALAEECKALRVSYEQVCSDQKALQEATSSEIFSLKSQLEMTETEKLKLNEERSTLMASIDAAENQIKVLRDQVIGVESTSDKGLAELREQILKESGKREAVETELRGSAQALAESKELNALQKDESAKLRRELEEFKSKLTQLKSSSVSKDELELQLQSAQQREEALSSELKTVNSQHESEIAAARRELTEANQLLRAQRENTADSSKSSIERLEQEKFELLERVTDLEGKLAKANEAPVPEPGSVEADFKMQVDFLNSVIVDQRKKVQELELNIDILKRTSLDDMGLRNGLPKIPAPRLYCDICEEFDVHDTDDCPKQAGEMDDLDTHSRPHGSRSEERPYCDNCETFGHWSAECDNETF